MGRSSRAQGVAVGQKEPTFYGKESKRGKRGVREAPQGHIVPASRCKGWLLSQLLGAKPKNGCGEGPLGQGGCGRSERADFLERQERRWKTWCASATGANRTIHSAYGLAYVLLRGREAEEQVSGGVLGLWRLRRVQKEQI